MQMFYHHCIYFLGIILFINLTKASQNVIIQAEEFVIRDKKLDGFAFWSMQVSDIGTCARSCLRVKKCQSFNFKISTRFCDLNDRTRVNSSDNLRMNIGVIYSEIDVWPSEV